MALDLIWVLLGKKAGSWLERGPEEDIFVKRFETFRDVSELCHRQYRFVNSLWQISYTDMTAKGNPAPAPS